jgi:hypothetical protein
MSLWSKAAELAAQTPPTRNRTADFLRALSILAVVFGHWFAAAPYVHEGRLTPTHVLAVADWTHWLTWVVQVMPIFFLVGGFSNGLTWRAARRDGLGYAAWLDGRLRRLVGPVLPLLGAWIAIGGAAHLAGLEPEWVRRGSQMALIPVWFLAVYLGVVALVPLSLAAWERWRFGSLVGLALLALATDLVFFGGARAFGWLNYLFVWSAVHQLGYAWGAGELKSPRRTLPLGALGLAALVALTTLGPYPRAMVGVPGDALSNTTPPKITLLALAAAQSGFLLALEPLLARFLARARPWTATVLVNGLIMSVYLWHLTAMVLWIGLAHVLGDLGLRAAPGSSEWWRARPLWLATLTLVTVPFVLLFSRFERPKGGAAPAAAWRLVLGTALFVTALALLALDGITGSGWLGLRVTVLALPFVGALLIGMGPRLVRD